MLSRGDLSMPLRDHFHAPISRTFGWEGFHGTWPAMLVGRVRRLLPPGYIAEPRARMGQYFELDIGTFEQENSSPYVSHPIGDTATIAEPTVSADIDIGDQHEYEVLIYEVEREKRLVAAVEFVSPGNKDRIEHRQAFVSKCSALLQQNVSVAIVDVVTNRSGNLYAELLGELGVNDPTLGEVPPRLYAASCRTRTNLHRGRFDAWTYPVVLGMPLPTLLLWYAPDRSVTLDLEGSYEDTCQLLGIE
jgi:hypothetical protein